MTLSVQQCVDRGLALLAQIEKLQEELDEVQEKLLTHAKEGDQVALVDEEREGKQFLARGTAAIIPVIFTADKLMKTFQPDSKAHKSIYAIAGRMLPKFYERETVWAMVPKDGKAFRKVAGEILGANGPALVTACVARDKDGIPKSDIKIEWKKPTKIAP